MNRASCCCHTIPDRKALIFLFFYIATQGCYSTRWWDGHELVPDYVILDLHRELRNGGYTGKGFISLKDEELILRRIGSYTALHGGVSLGSRSKGFQGTPLGIQSTLCGTVGRHHEFRLHSNSVHGISCVRHGSSIIFDVAGKEDRGGHVARPRKLGSATQHRVMIIDCRQLIKVQGLSSRPRGIGIKQAVGTKDSRQEACDQVGADELRILHCVEELLGERLSPKEGFWGCKRSGS